MTFYGFLSKTQGERLAAWETGDGWRETGDGRHETGDKRRETRDGRQETEKGGGTYFWFHYGVAFSIVQGLFPKRMRMKFLKNIPPPETFRDFSEPRAFSIWMRWACGFAAGVCLIGLAVCVALDGCGKRKDGHDAETAEAEKPSVPPPDLHNPVREAPATFPPDSNLPRGKEIYASGPIDLAQFDPARDLVRFEDERVWFESDHDGPEDDEDDHQIHRAVEVPLRRLVNLLERRGGKLKVQEAYRAASSKNRIHLPSSLHREGRAVDLTCEGLPLSELAKLAWQAGFDFVLYEVPKRSGPHLHCSVRRAPDAPLPPRPGGQSPQAP